MFCPLGGFPVCSIFQEHLWVGLLHYNSILPPSKTIGTKDYASFLVLNGTDKEIFPIF